VPLNAWNIDKARINAETSYGPWKNNFFASYFALTLAPRRTRGTEQRGARVAPGGGSSK